MARQAEQILREALELPPDARAALADSLLVSLDGVADTDAEHAWRGEIERRMASLDRGTAQRVSWEEVRSRLVQRLQH